MELVTLLSFVLDSLLEEGIIEYFHKLATDVTKIVVLWFALVLGGVCFFSHKHK